MLPRHSKILTCLIAGGLASVATVPAQAQSDMQEGIVRISDTVNPSEKSAAQRLQPIPSHQGYSASAGSEYMEVDCPNCPGGRRLVRRHRGTGYDFSPPVKRPIYRTGVAYNKMFPDAWTGQPSQAVPGMQYPTVYMPTDTTQLGYYYQHVPYWQPREGMVPPPPVPSQWHTTVAQSRYTGHHPAGKILGTAPTAIPYSPTGPYGPYNGGEVIYGSPIEAGESLSPTPAGPEKLKEIETIGSQGPSPLAPITKSPQLIPTN